MSGISAGLSHQTLNFKTLIKYCYLNNLKLIKPIFTLIGKHNKDNEIKNDLSKYYDLKNITVNNKKFKLYNDNTNIKYTIKQKSYKYGLLSEDKMFKNSFKDVKIPYTKEIYQIANKVAYFLKDYMCIHVRRGDRIVNKQIDKDTSVENIKSKIDQYKPKAVYIMTNRVDEIISLKEIKNLYFYTDFDFLKSIKDNYYLFSVENVIMDLAKIKCSTFNTKLHDPNSNYYDCYLSNSFGAQ